MLILSLSPARLGLLSRTMGTVKAPTSWPQDGGDMDSSEHSTQHWQVHGNPWQLPPFKVIRTVEHLPLLNSYYKLELC